MTIDNWSYAGRNNWVSVSDHLGNFSLKVNQKATTLYTNFKEAAAYNAQCIRNDWAHKKLYLMLSGGVDSEFVANTLLSEKIPFTPVIVDFGEFNYQESWFAYYWCKTNNITPIVLKFTVDELIKKVFSKYLPMLPKTQDGLFPLITLYVSDYIEELGGVCLTGLADPNWDIERQEFYCGFVDFPLDILRPGKHPSGFFIYTPEVTLSYVHQFDKSLDEQYNKLSFYGVSPRAKYNFAEPMLYETEAIKQIIKYRVKKFNIKDPVFHWYGSKEKLLESLY